MLLKACGHGHFYDGAKFLECPHCAGGLTRENFLDEEMSRKKTRQLDKTKKRKGGRQYTAGWLVCTGGAVCGRTYPFYDGENLVGIGRSLDISFIPDAAGEEEIYFTLLCNSAKDTYQIIVPENGQSVKLDGELLAAGKHRLQADQMIQTGDLTFLPVAFDVKKYKK